MTKVCVDQPPTTQLPPSWIRSIRQVRMPDQQPPPPPPRRPPTAALAPSNSSSPMLLSASSSASSTSLLRSRALAKVKSAAHSTSDYVSPKLETAATKVRNYKANATTSSSWDRNDDPGILTTPKKVQKSRQQQHQGSMSEFDAMLLRGSALPSPSLSSSDQQQQKASRWGGIGSYFTGNSSMSSSSSSMSGSSSSGTMKPPLAQDLEKEKIVCFPGVSPLFFFSTISRRWLTLRVSFTVGYSTTGEE